jgi:hypothetical protein
MDLVELPSRTSQAFPCSVLSVQLGESCIAFADQVRATCSQRTTMTRAGLSSSTGCSEQVRPSPTHAMFSMLQML